MDLCFAFLPFKSEPIMEQKFKKGSSGTGVLLFLCTIKAFLESDALNVPGRQSIADPITQKAKYLQEWDRSDSFVKAPLPRKYKCMYVCTCAVCQHTHV